MHAYERKRGRRGGRARINGRKARWVKNEKADRIAKDVDKIAKCFLSLQAVPISGRKWKCRLAGKLREI